MKLTAWLKGLLYPERCIFCGADVPGQNGFLCCRACLREKTKPSWTQTASGYRSYSAAVYADEVRSAIHRFKFRHKPQYAYTLARFMAGALPTDEEFDIIVWAPASFRRRFVRGYDQSRLLAKELSSLLSLPMVRGLRKIRHTRKQSGLDAAARLENAKGAYEAYISRVRGQRILVVDDVYTTGATMNECMETLKNAGAYVCTGITVASTRRGRK